MKKKDLEERWRKTLGREAQNGNDYHTLAEMTVELYNEPDLRFRQHVKNRLVGQSKISGEVIAPEKLEIGAARAFIADEVGFAGWNELMVAVENSSTAVRPMIFEYTVAAMRRGDFTALEHTIGGPNSFAGTIIKWFEAGYFSDETETLDEIFAASCMLGHTRTVEFLLDLGVDPYAGMRTGLAGFHWSASSGRLEVVKLLAARGVPMEIENIYGGTVLEQALWSACNEHKPDHAAIVEVLIEAGALIRPGTIAWWKKQYVPSAETRIKIVAALEHG